MTPSSDNANVIVRPPLIYLAALLALLALRWGWPAPIVEQRTVVLVSGVALAVASVAFGLWARGALVKAGTNLDPLKPSLAIVTSGPFALSRNPIYVALAGLYLGLALAFDTWWGIALLVPLLAVMHFGVILREERYLEQKFGDEYRRYRTKVARYAGCRKQSD